MHGKKLCPLCSISSISKFDVLFARFAYICEDPRLNLCALKYRLSEGEILLESDDLASDGEFVSLLRARGYRLRFASMLPTKPTAEIHSIQPVSIRRGPFSGASFADDEYRLGVSCSNDSDSSAVVSGFDGTLPIIEDSASCSSVSSLMSSQEGYIRDGKSWNKDADSSSLSSVESGMIYRAMHSIRPMMPDRRDTVSPAQRRWQRNARHRLPAFSSDREADVGVLQSHTRESSRSTSSSVSLSEGEMTTNPGRFRKLSDSDNCSNENIPARCLFLHLV